MSITTRFRILTSLGIGAIVAVVGSVTGWLLLQAGELFGWPVIIGVAAFCAVAAFVVDVVTEPRSQ